jgi:hypothetical protein
MEGTQVLAAQPCPKEDLVGSCEARDENVVRFYGKGAKPFTPETAKANCASQYGGRFF